MKHIISRSLAWLVAGLGITTSVMGQNLPSFQTGPGNTFSQQTNGWPPTASNFDPLVPTENQFSSGTAFGGWLTHRITDGPNGTGNVLAGSETLTEGPTTIKVSSFSATVPTESLQMDSVKMGRPLVARQATVFFGSTISPPLVDASGQALPEGSFLAEPVNSSTSIYFAQSGLQEGRFYYSPHARAVFATQTGVVNVVWKYKDNTRVPSTQAIQYVVSSTPSTPAQRIYWTEKGFTGPVVTIPAGVVSEVSIRYNSEFQGLVSTEYQSPFALPADPAVSLPPEKRTFWYSKDDRSFRAYNAEGRVFVEFLGALRQDGVSRNFLGSEVVEVIRETKPKAIVTMIGDKLKPADGDTSLEARIVNGLVAFPAFLHQENSPTEKKYNYYAIRTTSPGETPDTPTGEVLLYWMKKGALGLQWPKYLDSHIVRWPEVSDANYATYIRADGAEGGAADTAAVFDTANNSALVFEDDNQGSVNEAIKFHTTLSAGNPDNLTLIRHGSGDNIWFERVHSVLNTAPEVSSSVIEVAVGDRIEPPTGLGLEPVVGYIHQKSGTGYDPTAYLNPFVEGSIPSRPTRIW